MSVKSRGELLEYLTEWKAAYQTAFGPISRSVVFDDLAAFCHARQTCVVPGDREQSYMLEGRRQVYLRIINFLELEPEELIKFHSTGPL